jgi:hypothetical protein
MKHTKMLSADTISNIAEFYMDTPDKRLLFLTLNHDVYEDVRELPVRFTIVYKPGAYKNFTPDYVGMIIRTSEHVDHEDIKLISPRLRNVYVNSKRVGELTEEMPQLKNMRIELSTNDKITINRDLYKNIKDIYISDSRIIDASKIAGATEVNQVINTCPSQSTIYSLHCDDYKGNIRLEETTILNNGGLVATTKLIDDEVSIDIASRIAGNINIMPDTEQIRDLIVWGIYGIFIRDSPARIVAPFEFGTRLKYLTLHHAGFDVDVELPHSLVGLDMQYTAAMPNTSIYIDEHFTELRKLRIVFTPIKHVHKSVAVRLDEFICACEPTREVDDEENYINASKVIHIDMFPNATTFGGSRIDEFPISPKLSIVHIYGSYVAGDIPAEYAKLRTLSLFNCPNITGCIPSGPSALNIQRCGGIKTLADVKHVRSCVLKNLDIEAEVHFVWKSNISVHISDCPNITGTINMMGHTEANIEVDKNKIIILE